MASIRKRGDSYLIVVSMGYDYSQVIESFDIHVDTRF